MGTQIIPDSTEQNQPSLESQSQEIPPTPNPDPGPIEPKKDPSEPYLALLREQNQKINELNEELTRTRNAPPPAPVKTREEQSAEFYNDPLGTIDDRVSKALERTIAPLTEFVAGLKRTSAVDNFVDKFKADPRFQDGWNSQLDQYVRSEAGRLDPSQLNENNFGMIVLVGMGMQSRGLLPGATIPNSIPTPVPTPTPIQAPTVQPPHLRPSSSPPNVPGSNGGPKIRELTELELRLARERGQSPEEYIKWMEVPASGVINSKIGQPEKK